MNIKKEFLQKAQEQFCKDFYCEQEDFNKNKNIITHYGQEISRQYPKEKPIFRMMCYYDKLIVTAAKELFPWAEQEFKHKFSGWAFSYLSLKKIDQELNEFGHEIKDMHHYYLPLSDFPKPDQKFALKWYERKELEPFRSDHRFSEAVAFHPRYPDVIAVAAMKGEEIMGLAGASEEGSDLRQIGINVLTEYRGIGVAVNLVANLKEEIIRRGRLPFYGTVESHNLSKSVAIKAGFFPVWSEIYSGPILGEG